MPKPFEKGDPRINRAGRPKKGQCLTDILNWSLDQKKTITDTTTGQKKSVLLRHLLADKLISKAIKDGDVAAMKYIYDRIDGRAKETIDISTPKSNIPNDPEELKKYTENLDKRLKELYGTSGLPGNN